MSEVSIIQFGDNNEKHYSSEYNIIECNCSFNRTYDCCMPHADAKCENIEISIEAPGMTDLNLFEWFIGNTTLSGRILLNLSGSVNQAGDSVEEIYFENAYCSIFSEKYDIQSSTRRILRIVMVPMSVIVYDVGFPRPE